MKSLDEIIKALSIPAVNGYHYIDSNDAIDALKYLEMYKELANDSALFAKWKENSPLTWNELKDMEGDPIWIEMAPNPARWGIITEVVNTDQFKLMHIMSVDEDKYPIHIYCTKDSINPWAAYRKER